MSSQCFDHCETGLNEKMSSADLSTEASLSTKLERRRRIEDFFEEKRLREELGEFDLA